MPDTKLNPNPDQPPVFRSWRQVYTFVLVLHVLTVAFFYWFKIAFS